MKKASALSGLALLAVLAGLAQRVDADLWHYETADGRSIRKAQDFMLPHVKTPPEKWPYQQIATLNHPELAPVFRQASMAYHDPRYEAVVTAFPNIERASFQLLHPAASSLKENNSANQTIRESSIPTSR